MKCRRPVSVIAGISLLLTSWAAPRSEGKPQPPVRLPGAEQVQVNLVLIDVVVRDRKDQPVSGLTRDDFELLVDRLPVVEGDIESFEEVCPSPGSTPASRASDSVAKSSSGDTPASTANDGPPTASPRHIVVYLDFSQLSLSGRQQALRAARDHLATGLGPDDRVMILAFRNELRLVQEFTNDGSLLASRLDEMIGNNTTLDTDVLEEPQNLNELASKSCDSAGSLCTARRDLAFSYAVREEMRARRSVKTLESLMPALAGLKGRKALVLFTDVLREEPGVQYVAMANVTPRAAGVNLEPDLLRLTREANAAGVSIYTVHASGLDDSSVAQFRDARPITVTATGKLPSPTDPSAATISEVGASHSQTYEAARTGLDSALALQTTAATETGGRALQRTNDLGRILTTAQQDLSCYYLIGYRYQGRGDGQQHSLLVRLRPDSRGEPRRGLTLRYRPYYTDYSQTDRRERLIRSALEAPDLFHSFRITTEAFALAPDGPRRRVLIKTTAPLDALSLIPSSGDVLEGRLTVRGEVSKAGSDEEPACRIAQDVPLRVPRGPAAATRLVFETGCLLEPGQYQLSLALLDPSTQEVGARRSDLAVPVVSTRDAPFLSDVYLWARDTGSVVVSAGAESIGMKNGASESAYVPRSERRLVRGQEALLSFLFCPPTGAKPTPASPIRVQRTLVGEGETAVASFRDLTISEPPDEDTGCYQLFNTIPANTLGDGIYRFTIRLMGPSLGAPLTREAALAVD